MTPAEQKNDDGSFVKGLGVGLGIAVVFTVAFAVVVVWILRRRFLLFIYLLFRLYNYKSI